MYFNQFIQNSRFLITGGAGFIGSNMVAYLVQHNAKKIKILDNLSNGYLNNIQEFLNLPNVEFIEGDITNMDTCTQACKDVDYISHQAALGSVPRSLLHPADFCKVNIEGFVNMLTAAKNAEIKRFVYASSSSVYGDSPILPKKEETIGNPLSPYAVSKFVNEQMALVFNNAYNFKLETIGLRYFNVFGPKQSPNGVYAAVIPLFIEAVLQNKNAFINGDGFQTRDFTYIDNVIQINLLAMFTNNKPAINQVYNVGVGEQTSLNELFDLITLIENKNSKPSYREARNGDIRNSQADISKAIQLLNYQPTVFLKQGLLKTYHYFKNIINY
ncbi:MAG: SDR family oxidoreductase [Sediminibacterium sp.]|nr:SDR family oxidoreductase [Sediminibacterium sp.]